MLDNLNNFLFKPENVNIIDKEKTSKILSKKTKRNIEGTLIFFIVIISLILGYAFFIKENNILRQDLSKPKNIFVSLLILFIVIYAVYFSSNVKLQNATYSAMAAFIIAITAHLDLPFTSFFFIWIYHYYFKGEELHFE
jgi:predicted nucleic acid-binding Zn ribbon protein